MNIGILDILVIWLVAKGLDWMLHWVLRQKYDWQKIKDRGTLALGLWFPTMIFIKGPFQMAYHEYKGQITGPQMLSIQAACALVVAWLAVPMIAKMLKQNDPRPMS